MGGYAGGDENILSKNGRRLSAARFNGTVYVLCRSNGCVAPQTTAGFLDGLFAGEAQLHFFKISLA